MLYNLEWLAPGKSYPPQIELDRLKRYKENAKLFSSEHYGDCGGYHNTLYANCIERLCKSIEGIDRVVCFPVILNYQRAISLKTADLVCGEYPTISGKTDSFTDKIKNLREVTEFDSKMYSTVIDLSRYGDAIWRVYKSEETNKGDFTIWSPENWFPIVADDGTYREKFHVICWKTNIGTTDKPLWELRAQVHEKGFYTYIVFAMDQAGAVIGSEKSRNRVSTGLTGSAIIHLKNISTSGNVYGYDDYMPIDSLLSEILTRIGQVSKILDEHAAPSMHGPASMLKYDQTTGKRFLEVGKFYATGPGETAPGYLTWDGQLEASFKELDVLLTQLYMLSELGEALLGTMGSNGQAISGTAMRFKLANPLIKARRISNGLTMAVKNLISSITEIGYERILPEELSIVWKDGLPNDPKELAETASLVTNNKQLMPLDQAISEYFDKTSAEALSWVRRIEKENENNSEQPEVDPSKPTEQPGPSGSVFRP